MMMAQDEQEHMDWAWLGRTPIASGTARQLAKPLFMCGARTGRTPTKVASVSPAWCTGPGKGAVDSCPTYICSRPHQSNRDVRHHACPLPTASAVGTHAASRPPHPCMPWRHPGHALVVRRAAAA